MTEDIIRYIDEEMTPEEKKAFEDRLSADPKLQTELKYARAAKKVSEDFIVAETFETIEKIRFEGTPHLKKGKSWLKWIILGITVIFLGLFYWMMTRDKTGEEVQEDTMILAGVYEEPIWPIERSDDDILSSAVRLHFAGRTDESLELLLRVEEEVPDIQKYWAAEIMVHDGRYSNALPLLSELAETNLEKERVNLLIGVCATNLDMQGR